MVPVWPGLVLGSSAGLGLAVQPSSEQVAWPELPASSEARVAPCQLQAFLPQAWLRLPVYHSRLPSGKPFYPSDSPCPTMSIHPSDID